jgi:cell wall-associated NlpC family hydrolase
MMPSLGRAVKATTPQRLSNAGSYADKRVVIYRSHFQVLASRFVFGVRVFGVLLPILATGCAARGTVATPRPFPGAAVPPRSLPEDVRAAEPITIQPAIVSLALSLRGTPYRNGGSDLAGFDCSGFVQWVFAQEGLALPREVRQQYRVGRDIDTDEVKAGDLVFFETVSPGASHVGIALGGGEFVHAPSSRGVVRIERYTSGYWADRWVGARRVTAAGEPAS